MVSTVWISRGFFLCVCAAQLLRLARDKLPCILTSLVSYFIGLPMILGLFLGHGLLRGAATAAYREATLFSRVLTLEILIINSTNGF